MLSVRFKKSIEWATLKMAKKSKPTALQQEYFKPPRKKCLLFRGQLGDEAIRFACFYKQVFLVGISIRNNEIHGR